MQEPGRDPGDADILAACRELVIRITVTGHQPRVIDWVPRVATRHTSLPLDQAIVDRDRIILGAPLRGRLTAEEWKPLLASALIYETVLSGKRKLGLLAVLAIPLVLMIPFFISLVAAATPLLPRWANALGAIMSFIFLGLALGSGLLVGTGHRRHVRLEADIMAAQLFSREEFLGILEKIILLGIPAIERSARHKSWLRASEAPSILERIENLQQPSPRPGYSSIVILSFVGGGLILLAGIAGLLTVPSSSVLAAALLAGVGMPSGGIIIVCGLVAYASPRPPKTLSTILIVCSLVYWTAFTLGAAVTNGGDLPSKILDSLLYGLLGPLEGIAAGILFYRKHGNSAQPASSGLGK